MHLSITHNIPTDTAEYDLLRAVEKAIAMHPANRKTYNSHEWAAYSTYIHSVITAATYLYHTASVMQGITADPDTPTSEI